MPSSEPEDRGHDRRSDAREQAVSLLYEADQRGGTASTLVEGRGLVAPELTRELVEGVEGNRDDLDSVIATHSRGWALHRMPALDRAILRMATYELVHRSAVPTAVIIDEAVELAKRFSTEDSGRFVNGVLASVARTVRPEGQ